MPPAGSDLGAVEHVIFLMMENRSFDHYYGTYPGARGFDDHPAGDLGPFSQACPSNTSASPVGRLLPFRLNTVSTDLADCTFDLTHNWKPQHLCRNEGKMDSFARVHQMRRSVQTCAESTGSKARGDHRARGSLSVGSSHMNETPLTLRIA